MPKNMHPNMVFKFFIIIFSALFITTLSAFSCEPVKSTIHYNNVMFSPRYLKNNNSIIFRDYHQFEMNDYNRLSESVRKFIDERPKYKNAQEAYEDGALETRYTVEKSENGTRVIYYSEGTKIFQYDLNFYGEVSNFMYHKTEKGSNEFCGKATGLNIEVITCHDLDGTVLSFKKMYFNEDNMMYKEVYLDGEAKIINWYEYDYNGDRVTIREFDAKNELVDEYTDDWKAIR